MKTGKILSGKNNRVLVEELWVADTFFRRLQGLIGKDFLFPGQGLLLIPCNMVHTFFMKFPLDVVYLDSSYRVMKVIHRLSPHRLGPLVRGAKAVLEVAAGWAETVGIKEGDLLRVELEVQKKKKFSGEDFSWLNILHWQRGGWL
ncbi:MAG: uncharacterized protein PWQ91_1624 [Eubacteriales bacterium]|nr:uncharacterized protein [Eubacteriales bacterium]MDN5364562.1 uncharacterized protein [Eubacteriales bacterium]